MAVGDVKTGISSVAEADVLDILPSSEEEWGIPNIYYSNGTGRFLLTNCSNYSYHRYPSNITGRIFTI